MVARHLFGMRLGFKEECPEISHPKYLIFVSVRNGRWLKLSIKRNGFQSLVIQKLFPLSISPFVQLWALIQRVHLNKGIDDDISWKLMANSQYSFSRHPLTSCNSSFWWSLAFTKLFGRLGRLLKQRIMFGLLCKIGFGRRIDRGNVVETIVGFVRFASKLKKTTTTYLCIAASPLEFGSYSRIEPKALGSA
jgi:hypothetical protein